MSIHNPAKPAAEYGLAIHPACDLLPPMDDAALERLSNDLREHGQLHPIITLDAQILDGRNRLVACRITGVEPRFCQWKDIYEGPLTPSGWVLIQNIHRRHLTDDQRIAATVALRAFEEQELARQRQAEGQKRGGCIGGRSRPKGNSIPTNSSESLRGRRRHAATGPQEGCCWR